MRLHLELRSGRSSLSGGRLRFRDRRLFRSFVACAAFTTLAGSGAVLSNAPDSLAATATKSPIVIGGIATASDFTGTNFGFQARIDALNKQGGIDGHPVQFVGVLDDGGSGVTDETDIQQLVLKDHAMEIAPVNAIGFTDTSAAFAADHKTPVLGWGFLPTFCNNKWVWGFNGCLEPTGVYNESLLEPIVKKLGGNAKTIRAVDVENDDTSGFSGDALYRNLWTRLGAKFELGSTTMPTSGVTDYTPYVLAIMAKNPNVITLDLSFAENIALRAALVQAGYKGVTLDYVSYVPGLLASQPAVASALQGAYIGVQIPPQESATPATKQETKDITSIGQPSLITEGESLGYWQADMLIQMLQATAKAGRPLSGAGLEKTVNAGFTYKGALAGGIGPAEFPHMESDPVPCAGLVQVKGNNYKVAEPFACYTDISAK